MELTLGMLWGASLIALLLLLLAGALYQSVGSARDARRYPAPGEKVEVDGHRLHLYSTGEGSPTVVMESGLGSSSLSWRLVQPEVARFTRACSYDRAGLGWSDPSPTPPTTRNIVEQLRHLLAQAGIQGPYVLVGHSFGGFPARWYAAHYPDEVCGLVLVDALHPSEWLLLTEKKDKALQRAVRLCRRGAVLARLGMARFISFLVRTGILTLARFCVFLFSSGELRGRERLLTSLSKLPPELRPIIRAFWSQPKFFQAMANQIEYLPESAAQVAATAGYGEKPLVVLSASNPGPARVREQEAVARLSSNGKHIVASHSGHWIQLDQPELLIEAIRGVVEAVRQGELKPLERSYTVFTNGVDPQGSESEPSRLAGMKERPRNVG